MNNIRRLFTILFVILFIFSCKKSPTGSDSVIITFPDANFEVLIRETLSKPTGDISKTELETITDIYSHSGEISNIPKLRYGN